MGFDFRDQVCKTLSDVTVSPPPSAASDVFPRMTLARTTRAKHEIDRGV